MLRLIDTRDTKPMNFLVDSSAEFQPGQMAQMKVIGNTIVCGLSDGTSPYGIIDDINVSCQNCSTVKSGRVTVWFRAALFETDQFDTTKLYRKEMILYCDEYGRFTTKSGISRPPVATVVRAPNEEKPNLELEWI